MSTKILIVYFSRASYNYVSGSIVNLPIGNTEIAAKTIRKLTRGDLFKLEPVKNYSEDYQTCTDEAKKELQADARPEVICWPDSINGYNTIILCYPNWWGTMPMPVWTFLEKFDFSGKSILPLCTHEGSGMGRSESDIKKICPNVKVEHGLAIRGSSVKNAEKDIQNWLCKANLV